MKTFLWLLAVALTIFCVSCWCFASLVTRYIRDFRAGFVVPGLAHVVLMPHRWLLFCPVPWLVGAGALTIRREVSQRVTLIFTGTAIVAGVAIFWAVVLAAFVGAVPFKL